MFFSDIVDGMGAKGEGLRILSRSKGLFIFYGMRVLFVGSRHSMGARLRRPLGRHTKRLSCAYLCTILLPNGIVLDARRPGG